MDEPSSIGPPGMAMILGAHAADWTGTSGFRLLPADPLYTAPATASVVLAAGGHLATVSYTWSHPDDGPQEGLLTIGRGAEDGSLVALWADTWHQKPAPMSLTGWVDDDGGLAVEAGYGGGWQWRIVLDSVDPARLKMRMDNIIPTDQATRTIAGGPYSPMEMELARR